MKEILIVDFLCVFTFPLTYLLLQFHIHFSGNAEGLAESSEIPSILEYILLISFKQKEMDQNKKVCNS